MELKLNRMSKIIVIRKYLPTDECWSYLLNRNTVLGLSVEQVIDRYQGFEGIEIALNHTNPESIEKIHLLDVSSDELPVSRPDNAHFVGFDVGMCEEDVTIYSSIFNEVLFGYYEELSSFQNILNENFLFSDRASAEHYIKVHKELAAKGKDVEQGIQMTIYEIWKFNR